ncbi:MAG: VOC family protein [Propionibacteriaceae bacterium]|nr:VOC family protein [Propionibacteriaceae bacterium]
MHVDHVIYAVGPQGLAAETERFEQLLGVRSWDGGVHPGFGTRVRLIPVSDERYIEVVEVLDHPVAAKVPFGQAVRARSEMGGGWLGWVLSVDDLASYEKRLDRQAVSGLRQFPDGRALEWRQIGVKGLIADPQLPFFIQWVSDASVRPSALPAEIGLTELEIAGNRGRVEEWLGLDVGDVFDGVRVSFDSPSGYPGITAVTFETSKGVVRI